MVYGCTFLVKFWTCSRDGTGWSVHFSLRLRHSLSTLDVACGLNVASCVLAWKITWHFLSNSVSNIMLLLCKLSSACSFIWIWHSLGNTLFLCSSLVSVFIYTFYNMLVQRKPLLRLHFKSDKYFYNFMIIFWSLESVWTVISVL